MTPEEINRLIHTKVMERLLIVPCTDGQIDEYMGSYWRCTCGWISDFYVGEDKSTEHAEPIPDYAGSMDAAWQVFRHMVSLDRTTEEHIEQRQAFAYALQGNGSLFVITLEQIAEWTPEKICLAALQAREIETQ